VPTFPNARYLLNRSEYEFWSDASAEPEGNGFRDVQRLTFADSVRPVFAAGLVDLVEGTHSVCDEVRLVPTPGHSPGHVSVQIASRGEMALITGDIAHHPCQLAHLDWGLPSIDFNEDQATATRQRVFAEVAEKPILVIGTHWAGATAGRVRRSGSAYYLEC
jgi:glyoxylase-like metal-dependent hydrolase (beta-lactamase superfamily II)